jgi:hypothetical protein
MRRTVVLGTRVLLGAAFLAIGGTLIYGLGAGYFPPLSIPPPFNLLVSVVLILVLLSVAGRIILWKPSR